jgi:hypothetical protein
MRDNFPISKSQLNERSTVDILSLMPVDPFYVLLSWLGEKGIVNLSRTCRTMRHKWLLVTHF